jgi:serine/threonine-protein kinase Chk2
MFRFNKNRVNFEEPLGEGAYGDVYAYKQKNPQDEQYAVKRITTPKVDTLLATMQEIVLGFNFDHPHVLPIKGYHIGFDQENRLWSIYMKMPRMETSIKGKINQYVREGKSFTEEEVVKQFYSLTLGLRYLHDKHIAHRDIKPDNILIDKNGNLKIADIGIGKLIEDEDTETLTQAEGTRLYTAPEVIAHANKLKKKGLFVADIWSLGVIMAEICVPKTRLINTNASGKDNEINLTKILEGLEGKYNKILLNLVSGMLRADPQERISLERVQKVLEESFSKILVLYFIIFSIINFYRVCHRMQRKEKNFYRKRMKH